MRGISAVLKNAQLPLHFPPHCLRHTFASLLLPQGESPAHVQHQLGHASTQLTVEPTDAGSHWATRLPSDRLNDATAGAEPYRSGSKPRVWGAGCFAIG